MPANQLCAHGPTIGCRAIIWACPENPPMEKCNTLADSECKNTPVRSACVPSHVPMRSKTNCVFSVRSYAFWVLFVSSHIRSYGFRMRSCAFHQLFCNNCKNKNVVFTLSSYAFQIRSAMRFNKKFVMPSRSYAFQYAFHYVPPAIASICQERDICCTKALG